MLTDSSGCMWTDSVGVVTGGGADIDGRPKWVRKEFSSMGTVTMDNVEPVPPKAPEVEAREAVERQRKDEADRQERARDSWQTLGSEVIQACSHFSQKALDRGPDLIRATALLVVAVGVALIPVALTIESVLR